MSTFKKKIVPVCVVGGKNELITFWEKGEVKFGFSNEH